MAGTAGTDADAAAVASVRRLLEDGWADHRHRATSLRLNESLRKAAEIAVERGWAPTFTALVEQGLAARLAEVVASAAEQAALDEHYAEHPDARPDLWEIAVAAANLDGSALGDHPDVIRRATEALGDDADVDRILAWASGALAGAEAR